jgi:hypothetical protein
VVAGRWALSDDLLSFVDLEPRLLQVLYDPLGELPAGIVAHVIFPIRRSRSRLRARGKADAEGELVAEAAVIHGGDVLALC